MPAAAWPQLVAGEMAGAKKRSGARSRRGPAGRVYPVHFEPDAKGGQKPLSGWIGVAPSGWCFVRPWWQHRQRDPRNAIAGRPLGPSLDGLGTACGHQPGG